MPSASPAAPEPSAAPPGPPERVVAGTLTLRRVSVDDAEALAAAVAASMDHLRPWMPWVTRGGADPRVQRVRLEQADEIWDAGTDYLYLILSGAGRALVGAIGLHRRVGPGGMEIGYWIHADHAGQGHGTAAARAITEVALSMPGIRRVEIHCDTANAASAAIPRKLGYRLDRMEAREPQAPAEQGTFMIWIMEPPRS
jgi:RimJ/RimL family protein N-acetyltransferase